MNKIPRIYVEDMIEAIALVEQYLHDVEEARFSQDMQLQDAVIRRLAVIGEAASKLSADIKTLAPEIPWRTIIGFRNIAIHEYAGVHMGRVWEITHHELSILKQQLTVLLQKLPPLA